MFFRRILFLIAFIFLASPFPALADPGLSLKWVLAQVRQNNPEIRAAKAETEAARAGITSSRSWPDPQIGVEFWDLPRPGLDLGAAGQRWLDISQEIPFPSKTFLESRIASHQALLMEATAHKVLQAQLFEAKQAYWDLYAAVGSLKALSASSQALGGLIAVVQRRGSLGKLDRSEQLMAPMARMERVTLENQSLALEQEKLSARQKLKRLMGMKGEETLTDPSDHPALNYSLPGKEVLLKQAEESGPEIMEARHHLLHTQAQRRLASAGWLPDLMLQYSLVDMPGGPQTSMAMAKVNVPFIWFWRQAGQQAAAKKEEAASEAMLQSAQRQAEEAVIRELAFLKMVRQQLSNLRQVARPEADRVLRLGLSSYQSGVVGTNDALGVVRAYSMTTLETVGLQAEAGRSLASLERLAGAEWVPDVMEEMNHEKN